MILTGQKKRSRRPAVGSLFCTGISARDGMERSPIPDIMGPGSRGSAHHHQVKVCTKKKIQRGFKKILAMKHFKNNQHILMIPQ